jgi:hypothetical protein
MTNEGFVRKLNLACTVEVNTKYRNGFSREATAYQSAPNFILLIWRGDRHVSLVEKVKGQNNWDYKWMVDTNFDEKKMNERISTLSRDIPCNIYSTNFTYFVNPRIFDLKFTWLKNCGRAALSCHWLHSSFWYVDGEKTHFVLHLQTGMLRVLSR